MCDEKDKGVLFFDTSDGLKPVMPVDKDASLGDILVMKEMLGGNQDVSAVMIDDEVRWIK